jgi:hypothetical protein
MLDSKGVYDTADASSRSRGLADDLEVLWAGLQQGACNDALATYGCRNVVLWDARPVRAQSGCAGWDVHLSGIWAPVQFPEEP